MPNPGLKYKSFTNSSSLSLTNRTYRFVVDIVVIGLCGYIIHTIHRSHTWRNLYNTPADSQRINFHGTRIIGIPTALVSVWWCGIVMCIFLCHRTYHKSFYYNFPSIHISCCLQDLTDISLAYVMISFRSPRKSKTVSNNIWSNKNFRVCFNCRDC